MTQASFALRRRNPDILTCIANLSNDEVFTPPELANQMLDMLAQAWATNNDGANIWADQTVTFLDPCTKSGVFLREITSRLTEGLKNAIPDLQERVNHILTKQVFGMATTRLTSLLARRSVYCSKTANGNHSIGSAFSDESGNIWYERLNHDWNGDKCEYCGAGKIFFDRPGTLETHAYAFIHTDNIQARVKEIFGGNMQFDVIIGNPPYQMNDGGGVGTSARPIYQEFVAQAIKLEPKYLTMVFPARWYSGGKGLDEFRALMMEGRRIRQLHDYPMATSVFPGVDIAGGVCFVLYSRDAVGPCEVYNYGDVPTKSVARELNEFPTFIRDNQAVDIVKKIQAREPSKRRLNERVSARKPFGLSSTYSAHPTGVPCWFSQRIGRQFAKPDDVKDPAGIIGKWKLLIPFAPIAGQTDFTKPVSFYYDGNTRIAKPGECCTETYLVAGSFDTAAEVESFRSYLFTKIVRYLLLQAVTSQNITRQYFYFIPDFENYQHTFTDKLLRERWDIDDEEWKRIDARIG
jgi:site-specific DNA-methyltransferase (adenine-specific)